MGRRASVLGLLLFVLLVSGQVLADKRPGKHTHDEKGPQGQTMEGHTHKHDTWEPPLESMRAPGAHAGTIQRRLPEARRSFRPTAWCATESTARGQARQPRASHMPLPISPTTFTECPVMVMRTNRANTSFTSVRR
jgi:hypothetical protein